MERLPRRDEIDPRYKWNLQLIYATDEDWEADFARLEAMLPQLTAYRNTLSAGAANLLGCLQLMDEIGLISGRLSAYATMRKDEDNTNSTYQAQYQRVISLWTRVSAAAAFFMPELLAIEADKLAEFMAAEEGLGIYRQYLDDLARHREHVRSPEVEAVLAEVGEVARAPQSIFSMLDNADIKFPAITDEEGRAVELTKGRYQRFLQSKDRRVRQEAFKALYSTYRRYENTLATALGANVRKDAFYARVRGHTSSLSMALHGGNIPEAVYTNLIETVHRNLPTLHRYIDLRRRLMHLGELHIYDLYVPLVEEVDWRISYDEAVDTVLQALAPLGEEYGSILRQGLKGGGWVDVFETQGKTGGGYSMGAYSTPPYILLNYQDNVESMYTLAHEVGHSMHSYLTRATQPYIYGRYTIFVAEVASMVNEALLTAHLLGQVKEASLMRYLINHQLDAFRTTLYRQAMFAEFELEVHSRVARGEALTPEGLCSYYKDLVQRYHGPNTVADPEISLEWARIPHFYRTFYVYQYATGMAAAMALSRQILGEGQGAVERYLTFLRAGSSDYSTDLLARAGVDMTRPEPVQQALDLFADLVGEMERLSP